MITINAIDKTSAQALKLAKEALTKSDGELVILVDNPGTAIDVISFLKRNGLQVTIEDNDGTMTLAARPAGSVNTAHASVATTEVPLSPSPRSPRVVTAPLAPQSQHTTVTSKQSQPPHKTISQELSQSSIESAALSELSFFSALSANEVRQLSTPVSEQDSPRIQGDAIATVSDGVTPSVATTPSVPQSSHVTNVPEYSQPPVASITNHKRDGRAFHDHDKRDENFVVLIRSSTLGTEDPKLGRILMLSFMSTLANFQAENENGSNPSAIILMNGGVKLATFESSACDYLKDIETHGTKIFVSGVCCAHFGITEKIGVGENANMYDIVTTLTRAKRVLSL